VEQDWEQIRQRELARRQATPGPTSVQITRTPLDPTPTPTPGTADLRLPDAPVLGAPQQAEDPWEGIRQRALERLTVADKAAAPFTRIGSAIAGGGIGLALGGPPGAIIGGMIGAGAGELGAEQIEVNQGIRKQINPGQVGLQTALGAIPIAGRASTLGRTMLSRGGQGALLGGVSAGASELVEGRTPTLGGVASGALLGAAVGAPLGALEARALSARPRAVPRLSEALEAQAPTHIEPSPAMDARIPRLADLPTPEGVPAKTGGSAMPNGRGGPVTAAEAASNTATIAPRAVPDIDALPKPSVLDSRISNADAGGALLPPPISADASTPKLVGLQYPGEGSTVFVQFDRQGAAVTPQQIKTMFPEYDVSVVEMSEGLLRPDLRKFRVDVRDEHGRMSGQTAKRLVDQFGGEVREWPEWSIPAVRPSREDIVSEAVTPRPALAQNVDTPAPVPTPRVETGGGAPPPPPPPPPDVPTSGTIDPDPGTPRRAAPTTAQIERIARASGDPLPDARPLPESRKVEPRMVAHLPEYQREDVLGIIEKHGGFEDARRSVVPNERTQAIAEWGEAERTRLKRGTILNAEDATRLNLAVSRVNDEIDTLVQKTATGQATDLDKITLAQKTQEQVILLANRLGVQAEIGRALQAQKMYTAVLNTKDTRLIQQALKILRPEDLDAFAAQWAALPNDLAKIDFLRKSQKLTTWDKVQAVRYANMLSGVKTHLRNVIGTSVNVAFRKGPAHVGAVAYDIGRHKLTGADRTIFLSELKPQAVAASVGLKRGLDAARHVMQHGISERGIQSFDVPRAELAGGLKNPFNIPGRALEAEDAFMFELVYHPELSGRLYAAARSEAMKQGLRGRKLDRAIERSLADGLANPPATIEQEAREAALEMLYREDGRRATAKIIAFKRDGGAFGKAAEFLVPFTKVPVNLLAQSIENVPGGAFVTSRGRAAMAAGGRREAEMAGRQIAGGVALASMWLVAESGLLSGKGPENAAERATLMQQGWRPNSVKIGDTWVDYGMAFQPISAPLFAVANLYETLQREGRELTQSDVETVIKSGGAAVGSVLDQSFLSGLADFTEAVNDPSRFAVNYAGRTAQSVVVPLAGLQRNIAQTIDPVVRQPETLGDHLKANVPVLSKQVPPKIEPLGKVAERGATAGFNPITASTESKDPVILALKKAEVVIGTPVKSLQKTRTQPQIDLTTEERQRIGRASYEAAERLTANRAWQRLLETEPERAQQTVEAAISRAREQVYTQIRLARRRAGR
jgi:hypothetical protein